MRIYKSYSGFAFHCKCFVICVVERNDQLTHWFSHLESTASPPVSFKKLTPSHTLAREQWVSGSQFHLNDSNTNSLLLSEREREPFWAQYHIHHITAIAASATTTAITTIKIYYAKNLIVRTSQCFILVNVNHPKEFPAWANPYPSNRNARSTTVRIWCCLFEWFNIRFR